MKRMMLVLVLASLMTLNYCSKEAEVSPERFQVLSDTLAIDLEYELWMDFAYEMSTNYPQEQAAAMVMLRSAERALTEQDEERFDRIFAILQDYPENGALEISDQIAFGNRLAWTMAEQMFLFNKAPDVLNHSIKVFEANESNLKWRDELGSMVYDTQGNIYERMDESEKAIESYGKALEYFEQPETFIRRGLIYETLEKLDEALEDYVSAMSLAPNQAMISNKVSEAYSKLNPELDANQFLRDLYESFMESRKEEVLGESFSMDAPEFEFTTMSGEKMNNANMLGKVVLVDFWATWCNPCRKELPEFQKFYDLYKNNPKVAFVAASTDRDKSKVSPYIAEMNYTFPVAYAESAGANFQVEGIPSLFIIGPSGKIRYKIVGFDPDKDFVREMSWRLESLLN